MTKQDEWEYAKKISKRFPNCLRPEDGSSNHALMSLLHKEAKKDGVKLDRSELFNNSTE